MSFIEICRSLIGIDTSPGQGTLRACEWLAEVARGKGLITEIQVDETTEHPNGNLIIRPRVRQPGPELMFCSPLDTADPGPFELWRENRRNPFDATIADHKIFGLGAADGKLDFVCKLEALAKVAAKIPAQASLRPVLVGTFGEHEGMAGALRLLRRNLVSPKWAFVAEPSNMQIQAAGKGSARVEIRIPFESDEQRFREDHNLRESTSTMSRTFHGVAAHASVPHLGDSALKKLFAHLFSMPENLVVMEIEGGTHFDSIPSTAFLEIDPQSGFRLPMAKKLRHVMEGIQRLEDRFQDFKDEDFTPANPTLCLGVVKTREDAIDFEGVVSMPPRISTEIYQEWVSDFSGHCAKVGASFRVLDYKKPYRTEPNSPFVRGAQEIMKSLGHDTTLGTHSSTNEASIFSRVGVDCISMGPGSRDGNIHSPSEHVKLDELSAATRFYAASMERFCR